MKSLSVVMYSVMYGLAIYAAFVCAGACAAPGVLKDALACLKKEQTDLSLIHGAIAWDTGAVRRMYDYGALGKRGDKIASKTIMLVHKLFHRPPDSSGAAGFLVTKPVRELSHKQIAEFVAVQLVFLKRLPYENCFKQYQKKHQDYVDFVAMHGEAEKKRARQLEKLAGEAYHSVIKSFDTSPGQVKYESPLKELVHYPIKAFIECVNNEYMSVTMPQTILQALLYKKTEGDSTASRRVAFRTYYELLDKQLGCLAHPLSATWELDAFTPEQRQLFLQEFKQVSLAASLSDGVPDCVYEQSLFAQAYERFVFLKLSPTDYPPLACEGDAIVQNVVFTDCMETALRNCSNFLAYNPQSGMFDVSLLEQRLGTRVHESLKHFYTVYPEASTVDDSCVHSDWVGGVVASIPNLIYCRALPMIDQGKRDCLKVIEQSPLVADFIAKKRYSLLSENAIAYDLRPSIKCFIMACDHLFGLQLFAHAAPDEWTKEGFVRTYLPKVLTALKAAVPATLDLDSLDYNDGTRTQLFIPLTFSFNESKKYAFTLLLHTQYDDGEIIFNPEQSSAIVPFLPETSIATPESLLFLQPYTKDRVSVSNLAWLFAQQLDDHTKFFALEQQIPVFDEQVLKVLLFCAHTLKEPDKQTALKCRIYQSALSRGLAGDKQVVQDAITLAGEAVRSKNTFVRGEALQVFKKVLDAGASIEPLLVESITRCAEELMQAGDRKSVSAALAIYAVLVTHNRAFDSATKAAQQGRQFMGVQPAGIRFEAIRLAAQLSLAQRL